MLIVSWALMEGLAATRAFGYDFDAYWMAAQRVAAGASAYDAQTLSGSLMPGPYGLYLYPPVQAAALSLIVSVPVEVATYVWALLHVGMLAAACALMPVKSRQRVLTGGVLGLSWPFLTDLTLGNVSTLVLLLACATWRAWPRRIAGIPLAFLVVSRQTAAILMIPALVGRRFGMLGVALGAGVAMVVTSLPIVGPSGWTDYLIMLQHLDVPIGVPASHDLATSLNQLGLDASMATSVQMTLTLAVGAAVLAMSRGGDQQLGVVAAITAAMLTSPLLWNHYLVLLGVPVAYLASRGRWWSYGLLLAAWAPEVILPFLPIVAFVSLAALAPRACWSIPPGLVSRVIGLRRIRRGAGAPHERGDRATPHGAGASDPLRPSPPA